MRLVRKLARLPRVIARSMREFGVLGGAQALVERAIRRVLADEDRRRDRELGLDIIDGVAAGELGAEGEHAGDGFAYEASPARLVRIVLRDVPVEGATFVDLGSGKGRTLLVAAELPFAEVVGVEYSAALHAIATRNDELTRDLGWRRAPVRLVHGDATTFPLPPGPCVVYLNNPFSGRVFAEVLANLEASLREEPRPLVVAYQQARHERASDRTDNLERLAAAPFLRRQSIRMSPLERLAMLPWRIERFDSRPDAADAG